MSIKLTPASVRLTVLGSGWNNSSINSGDGLTENGKLWEDIAGDLGYGSGSNVDWDSLSSGDDSADKILTDANGNRYAPYSVVVDLAGFFAEIAVKDSSLLRYSIEPNVLKNLYGGMVSQETNWDKTDPDRPHKYYPDVYYIQVSENSAYLFQEEAFWHREADGGNVNVNDISISIRSGSSMKVYWSGCSTHFDNNYLPYPYSSYPIEYVCWQCLWGSFKEMLISTSDKTATIDQIKNGEVYEEVIIDGEKYFKISDGGIP